MDVSTFIRSNVGLLARLLQAWATRSIRPVMRVLAGTALLMAPAGVALAGVASATAGQESDRRVLATTVDGPITPVVAGHLTDAVTRAEREGYVALVVRLDTPGGLDTSMRDIVQAFLASDAPVVVYVSPQGARAGSAGALITLAANVAAMAPGTAIGASTPVDLESGEVADKIVNDAAAFAEAVAEFRGRNTEVAVDMVREGRSLAASEALELGAVDVVVDSMAELLGRIDGRVVEVGDDGRNVSLVTADAAVDELEMEFFRRIQQMLADPNLAFLFLSIGTLAIIYELASPGMGAGGAVGVILILLALFSLSVLPVTAVGVLLLLLAAALFVAELFAPGIGVAAAGGTAALLLSGVFLVRDAPGLQVSLAVVIPVAVVVGGAVILAGRVAIRSRRAPSTLTGGDLLIGQAVTVQRSDGDRGRAFVAGSWWSVRTADGALGDGAEARVVAVDGLELVVEQTNQPAADNEGQEHQ